MKFSKKLCALIVSVLTVGLFVGYLAYGSELSSLALSKLPVLSFLHRRNVCDGELEVHFIDVGQGDSILIRSDEAILLIDAGTASSKYELEAYLRSYGINRIDCLILTHPHSDHIGGAAQIISSFKIGSILTGIYDTDSRYQDEMLEAAEENGIETVEPILGADYSVGDISFKVLSPDIGVAYSEMNNNSIAIRLSWGDTEFLFTGDAEAMAERDILEEFYDELESDVLKLGHHGSSTSTSEDFLEAVDPEWVVISCGKDNEYGHPHYETLRRLEDFGISDDHILRTDKLGSIILISDGETVSLFGDIAEERPAA